MKYHLRIITKESALYYNPEIPSEWTQNRKERENYYSKWSARSAQQNLQKELIEADIRISII